MDYILASRFCREVFSPECEGSPVPASQGVITDISFVRGSCVLTPSIELMVDAILDTVARKSPIVFENEVIEKILYDGEDINPIVKAALSNTKSLIEHAYLIGDNSLVYVSSDLMGVRGDKIYLSYRKCSTCIGLFHTHPIPLPIPTPSDAMNASTRNSMVECIGSLIKYEPVVVCMEPRRSWKDIAYRLNEFSKIIEKYTTMYAPVMIDDYIAMAPYPSPHDAWKILEEFENFFDKYINISISVFE